MNTIIVPLDGSEIAERALDLAETLARAWNARLTLVHILEEPVAFDLLPSLVLPDRFAAESYLRRIADQFPQDVEIVTNAVRGTPVDTLLALTNDDPESMVVMATHGRSGFGRLMLGSVADKVLREATVPVVLVRAGETPRHEGLRTLLVPLDTSSYGETALPVAIDLARRTGATLGLVHVCEPFWVSPYVSAVPELSQVNEARASEIERQGLTEGRAYLDQLASEIRAEGVRVVWEVRYGKPADEILRAARTTTADLIVMATHDRRGLRRLALGSVTNEVLHRGTLPILAIPPHLIETQRLDAEQLLSTL